jgi:hypothetical protein
VLLELLCQELAPIHRSHPVAGVRHSAVAYRMLGSLYTKAQADERYALGKFRAASAYVRNGGHDQKVLEVPYRGWIGVTCNRDAGNSVVRFHPADLQGSSTRVWTDEGNGAHPSWMGHYLSDPATFPKATLAPDDKVTFDIMAPSGAGVFVVTVHNDSYSGGGCNVVARYHGA